jgi:hypothetical protein
MAVFSGPEIVNSGLIHALEPGKISGSTYTDPLGSVWTINQYANGTTAGVNTLLSNVSAVDGSGNSFVSVAPNASLNTGSISVILWFNLKGASIDTSGGNEWRGLLSTASSGTAGSPFTMVLEQSGFVNFSVTNDDVTGYRRYLANSFSPYAYTANGWQMVAFTYNKTTGIGACYKNDTLVLTGSMTSDTIGTNSTAPGTGLVYTNYINSGGFKIGGANTSANPNGNGMIPGEIGSMFVYNTALSQADILQHFNALRSRFGL